MSGSGNLTQDRATSSGYGASTLNEAYEDMLAQFGLLGSGLIANNGDLIDNDLDESDLWSAGIETPEDIMALMAHLGRTYNVATEEDTGMSWEYNTDAVWVANWVYELIEENGTDVTKNTVLTIFDYLENQFASGNGLSLTEMGVEVPPRSQAELWSNESQRLSDLLQDQAMFFGNQYVSQGAIYNTARTGDSLTLTDALRNTNNAVNVANAQSLSISQSGALTMATKLLPARQQQNYQLTSGGGNPQQIPALSGGNSSPFAQLKGFSPTLRNSLSVQNVSKQQLSYEGNQQQFTFNQNEARKPVYNLMNGFDERTELGRFSFTTSTSVGITITGNSYTPDDTAIGGFRSDEGYTLVSLEDFQEDDWYLGTLEKSIVVSEESFEEYSKLWIDVNAWGGPEPTLIAVESFSEGWDNGSRPSLDEPSNCGGGAGSEDVFDEDLSAQIDGSNTVFDTSQNYVSGKLRVFRNGQRLGSDDVTEVSSSRFSLSFAPSVGEVLSCDYTPPT